MQPQSALWIYVGCGLFLSVLEFKYLFIKPKNCMRLPSSFLTSDKGSEDNGVDEYSTLYSGSLSSFPSLCGWWGRRAAVSFYEPRALEKISSNPQSKTLMRSTYGRWGGVGGRWGIIYDGWQRKEQRCLPLCILALPWPQMPQRRATNTCLPQHSSGKLCEVMKERQRQTPR